MTWPKAGTAELELSDPPIPRPSPLNETRIAAETTKVNKPRANGKILRCQGIPRWAWRKLGRIILGHRDWTVLFLVILVSLSYQIAPSFERLVVAWLSRLFSPDRCGGREKVQMAGQYSSDVH